jgi:hypothetical protein
MPNKPFFQARWPWMLLLAVFTLAAYWPGLTGGFIFDDLASIVDNNNVHAQHLDAESLLRAARSFEPGGGGWEARPLPMASFGINYALGGLNPWGYKLGGLLVHLINALLVFALLRSLLTLPKLRMDRWAVPASGVLALLWAIHPLQVSAVLYVVQRMETMSLGFVLLALLAYMHARKRQLAGERAWPWLLACLPLVALGLACKETAVLFFAYAFVLEFALLDFAASAPATQRNWRVVWIVAAVSAIALFAFVVVPHYWTTTDFQRGFGSAQRLLTQLRVLPMYLGQILLPLPSRMTFYYDQIQPSRGWLSPATTLYGGLLLLALLAAAIALRRRAPLVCLGVLWFFAAHALSSNVVALELAVEHRNYFAILGVLLAVFGFLRLTRFEPAPQTVGTVLALLVATIGFLTFLRASVWGDPLLLATDLAKSNPQSARAAADLGATYLEMADHQPNSPFYDFAIGEFERGAKIPGSSILNDQGLILAATQAGRPVEDAWWEQLVHKVQTQPVIPETSGVLFSLLGNRYKGVPLDDKFLTEAFVAFFDRVIAPPNSYVQFAVYLLDKAGNPELAREMFLQAIDQCRPYPDYARKIVENLRAEGHNDIAEAARARANKLGIAIGQ